MTDEELANKKVLESRLEAYQATCQAQGRKLVEVEQTLISCCEEVKNGSNASNQVLQLVTIRDRTLNEIREILIRKEH